MNWRFKYDPERRSSSHTAVYFYSCFSPVPELTSTINPTGQQTCMSSCCAQSTMNCPPPYVPSVPSVLSSVVILYNATAWPFSGCNPHEHRIIMPFSGKNGRVAKCMILGSLARTIIDGRWKLELGSTHGRSTNGGNDLKSQPSGVGALHGVPYGAPYGAPYYRRSTEFSRAAPCCTRSERSRTGRDPFPECCNDNRIQNNHRRATIHRHVTSRIELSE